MLNMLKKLIRHTPAGQAQSGAAAAPAQKQYESDRIWRLLMMGLNYRESAWNARAFAVEGYQKNVVVYRCIREIATACASVGLDLEINTADGTRRVESQHPVLDLLRRPNPLQSWPEFVEGLITNLLVSGNTYIWRNVPRGLETGGNPKAPPLELHLFSPIHMQVEPGKHLLPTAYTRTVDGVRKETYPVNPVTGDCDILHLKLYNPLDPWMGMSPLQAAALGVDIHNAGLRFNKALLDNSARPSGALKIEGNPDDMLIARLREQVRMFYQGEANAGSVPLLYGGADWVELGMTPKDMDFKQSMEMAALNIAAAYGVPFPLIVPTAATFANMRDAREAMWENTVLPLLEKLTSALDRWLLPRYADLAASTQAKLLYNADHVSALETKRQRKFERMIRAAESGLISQEEARAELGF